MAKKGKKQGAKKPSKKKPPRPGLDHPAAPQIIGQPGMGMMQQPPPPPPKGTILIGVGPKYVKGGVMTPGMVGTKILEINGTIPNEVAIIQAILQATITALASTPIKLDK